jgi:hypothetical protein
MNNPNNDQNPIPNKDKNVNVGTHQLNYMYTIGDFVAAAYENKCFIGKIADEDEAEFEIDFMEERKSLYQWPRNKDILWIKKSDVLFKVDTPNPTGKSARMFKFSDETMIKLRSFKQ